MPNGDASLVELPETVAAAVLGHPAVVALDGGPFGSVASYLPGRRVLGVRIGVGAEPVELSVVAVLGASLPRLADELGALVRGLLGPVAVQVHVADVAAAPSGEPPVVLDAGVPARPVVGGTSDAAPLA